MFVKAVSLSLLVALSYNVCMADIYLRTDEEGRLHARLKGVPLSEVRSVLEQGYGVLFKGDDETYQTQITLSFQNLSLEEALKRIFSRMGFGVVYNSEGKITEVYVFPRGGIMIIPEKTSVPPEKLSNNFIEIYAKKNAAKQTLDHFGGNSLSPGQQKIMEPTTAVMPTEGTGFQVIMNSPPGRVGAIDPSSFPSDDSFKVTPNSPPSGTSFQIVPSAPPARK